MQFRLRDFADPIGILRLRRFLAVAERWPDAAAAAYQTERLRALIAHANAHCPFWRERLAAAGVAAGDVHRPQDLRALPVLTKDQVRAHAAEMQATDQSGLHPCSSSTSGSTGTALRFLLDRPTNVLEFATLWRQFNWAGYRFGQRFADLRGHLIGSASGVARDRRLNSLNLSAFHLTRERVASYARALRDFRPVMIRGYPSSISRFASWALDLALELPRPLVVVTSSETLLEPQRRVVERAFRAPVLDYYGQMERVAFAGQCAFGRYHVAREYGVIELLDDHGATVVPGQMGRVVATGLHHRAMPFLRYDTRDLAVEETTPCPCGRPGMTLRRIVGRLEDFVLTPDGRHVGRLDAAFQNSPGVRLARILQSSPQRIAVEVVPGEAFAARDRERLLSGLRERLGTAIDIDIVLVESIPLEPSGKLKFVVSTLGGASPSPPA